MKFSNVYLNTMIWDMYKQMEKKTHTKTESHNFHFVRKCLCGGYE